MITTKPLKATCVDGDRHRRHGDACLARDRRGRALCVLCAEAKFRDSDDAPTTTERLALCSALADVAADASSQNDAMLREAMWCPRIAVFEEFCDLGVDEEPG